MRLFIVIAVAAVSAFYTSVLIWARREGVRFQQECFASMEEELREGLIEDILELDPKWNTADLSKMTTAYLRRELEELNQDGLPWVYAPEQKAEPAPVRQLTMLTANPMAIPGPCPYHDETGDISCRLCLEEIPF